METAIFFELKEGYKASYLKLFMFGYITRILVFL